MQYVVPMLESERGWGSKIDGYAGPFDSLADALLYFQNYNRKHNNDCQVPEWYIAPLNPIPYTNQPITYGKEIMP